MSDDEKFAMIVARGGAIIVASDVYAALLKAGRAVGIEECKYLAPGTAVAVDKQSWSLLE